MDYNWVKMPKLDYFENVELNIPSCRIFHGLSENSKTVAIGQTDHKL